MSITKVHPGVTQPEFPSLKDAKSASDVQACIADEKVRSRMLRLMLMFLKQNQNAKLNHLQAFPTDEEFGQADFRKTFDAVVALLKYDKRGLEPLSRSCDDNSRNMVIYQSYSDVPPKVRDGLNQRAFDALHELGKTAVYRSDLEEKILFLANEPKRQQYIAASEQLLSAVTFVMVNDWYGEKLVYQQLYGGDIDRMAYLQEVDRRGSPAKMHAEMVGRAKNSGLGSSHLLFRLIRGKPDMPKDWVESAKRFTATVLAPIWGEVIWNQEMEREFKAYSEAGIIMPSGTPDRPYVVERSWSPDFYGSTDYTSEAVFCKDRHDAWVRADIRAGKHKSDILAGKYRLQAFAKQEITKPAERDDFTSPSLPSNLSGSDFRIEPKERVNPTIEYHEIGSVYCEHGHQINGGVSTSRTGVRERIVVDWENDKHLQNLYSKILTDAGMGEGYNPTGAERWELLNRVLKSIKTNIRYDATAFESDNEILIGDSIAQNKGCCRHMGLVGAAILEHMILDGKLGGRVYYVRGKAHGWWIYESRILKRYVGDAAQQDKVIDMGSADATYYHGTGLEPYKDVRQMGEIANESYTVDVPADEGLKSGQYTLEPEAIERIVNEGRKRKGLIDRFLGK